MQAVWVGSDYDSKQQCRTEGPVHVWGRDGVGGGAELIDDSKRSRKIFMSI